MVLVERIRHSQWVMIGGLIHREGEHHPDMRLFLVPTSELEVLDTWYCAGLRGSGSHTVALDNVFVPEHRSVSFSTLRDACSPGSQVNTKPMYRTPFLAVHTYALLGPALGLARGGYADFVQWTRQRYLTYTALNVAQHVPVQIASPRSRRRSMRRSCWPDVASRSRARTIPKSRWSSGCCCGATSPTR